MLALAYGAPAVPRAQEEESALPLIKHYFTGPEMGALVGKIMGKRPTELMQARTLRIHMHVHLL